MSVSGGRRAATDKIATGAETSEPGPDLLKLGRCAESASPVQPAEQGDLLKLGRRAESAVRVTEPGADLLKLGRRVEAASLPRPAETEVARARSIREKIARWLEEKL